MTDDLKARVEAVRELTRIFMFERIVYLVATSLAAAMAIFSASSIALTRQATTAELTLLFGSSGMLTYSVNRLIFMWYEALKRLMPSNNDQVN